MTSGLPGAEAQSPEADREATLSPEEGEAGTLAEWLPAELPRGDARV
jgi:hypothetical protein